jgi:hypothetical protein
VKRSGGGVSDIAHGLLAGDDGILSGHKLLEGHILIDLMIDLLLGACQKDLDRGRSR